MKISRASDRPYRQLQSQESGEFYSRSHVLSETLGFRGAFFSLERIAPGTCSSRKHAHADQDEAILVLRGQVIVEWEGRREDLVVGDACVFPAGAVEHVVVGDGDNEAEVLLIRSL